MRGETENCAANVEVRISRRPNFSVTFLKQISLIGSEKNISPSVAINESWKEVSKAGVRGLRIVIPTAVKVRALRTSYFPFITGEKTEKQAITAERITVAPPPTIMANKMMLKIPTITDNFLLNLRRTNMRAMAIMETL